MKSNGSCEEQTEPMRTDPSSAAGEKTPEMQWLALSLVSGLGYKIISELLNVSGGIDRLLKSNPGEMVRDFGLSSKLAGRIAKAEKSHSFQIERRLLQESPEIQLLCPESKAYPLQLKEINSPPSIIYCLGDSGCLKQPGLAFVGSRTCTSYGRNQTRRLIRELADCCPELVIISGLARGIDTVAHEASLEAGLKTIAALAGGLKHIYPPENKELANKIAKNGVLISEFPLAVKPMARNFPIRNRIISGLSMGVVVTEARLKSGANISAAFAMQQNREVFALPGRVDSAASAGSNRLISRQRAKLIMNANDILEELPLGTKGFSQLTLPITNSREVELASLPENQQTILRQISRGIEDVDSLHIETGIEISILLAALLELELTGILLQTAAQSYRIQDGLILK